MYNPKKVNEILTYAALHGWSEENLADAQWQLRKMPVVPEGIERRTKMLRNSKIAFVLGSLALVINLIRVFVLQ